MPRVQSGPPCQICGAPSVAKSLCDKHYRRWKRHGHVEDTRPAGWGSKEKHPLYSHWTWTARVKDGRAPEWNDFYVFVEHVGTRPSERHRLKRFDISKPFGPDNFYWKEQLTSSSVSLIEKAAYQREWRSKNSARAKSYDLKRSYGIGIEQYDAMLSIQNEACAICRKPEHVFDKNGKLRKLAVDHCHTTGLVRGLLCTNCNKALGHFKDDVNLLNSAIKYLSAQS